MSPRVKPSPVLGAVFGIAYIVLFIGIAGILGGVITDTSTVTRIVPFLVSLATCSVVMIVLVTVLGWWPYILRDRVRVGGAVRIVPIVWIIVILFMAVMGQGWTIPTDRLLGLVLMAAMVGFSEEMAYRGLTLVGFRGGLKEQRAWLFATLLFALLHLPNALLGTPLIAAVPQVFLAFLGGTGLYLIRRTTGTIVAAMILHGAWDLTTFVNQSTELVVIAMPAAAGLLVFVLFLTQWKRLFGPDQQDQLGLAA